tara:strand:- start:9 stop:254 length:246 start_codon:yes stop_codon:yes gene_type:complete
MLVKDLIKKLQKVKNKEVPVRVYNQYVDELGTCVEIDSQEIRVVVGSNSQYDAPDEITQINIIVEDGRIDWECGSLWRGEE